MQVLVTDINTPTLLVAELLFLPLCGSHLNGNGEQKTSGTTVQGTFPSQSKILPLKWISLLSVTQVQVCKLGKGVDFEKTVTLSGVKNYFQCSLFSIKLYAISTRRVMSCLVNKQHHKVVK